MVEITAHIANGLGFLREHPAASAVNIALAIVPALVWAGIFLLEDRKNPEPKKMLAKVFSSGFIGGIVAIAIIYWFVRLLLPEYAGVRPIFGTFAHALVEETIKFLAVYAVIRKSKFFDEPVDAMIYMVTGAMGFAALENLFLVFIAANPFHVMAFRMFGAVLLHALLAGFVGFYWMKKRLLYGIILASAIHSLFNILILYFENGVLYGTVLLVIIAFFILRNFDIMRKHGTRQ
ncbi:MAG: hypothetical protein A3B23_02195 [Candidatus Colwellbacteria bacterium RIFCSPLOWO2_01_FULL_48_10]|uniref:Protease PrsW n=2 Tax=Bacteria candidate phyla TaxID=1783234 RepID=A0A1F5P3X2_9BACT|nr:MAG: hypothetical protein A2846_03700 [Candidatus Doudnabacteria bacterium RIFCSPHIGHO2_01_FULL_49_9]OGY59939.1 MAG: hypothetical protein A3B23_02195 [Candidatus Colwellbacteria bacterium RIFCSPLOWO2_01_FULL_48_10]